MRKNYFYGYEVSEYGKEHGRVDYRTLAKAVGSLILNNDIMAATVGVIDYWEQESGFIDYSEELEELAEKLEEAEDREDAEAIAEIEEQIQELEYAQDYPPEIYQWYIVDDGGAELLRDVDEVTYYNEALDIHLWGVTHCGTSWDYVLTDISLEDEE